MGRAAEDLMDGTVDENGEWADDVLPNPPAPARPRGPHELTRADVNGMINHWLEHHCGNRVRSMIPRTARRQLAGLLQREFNRRLRKAIGVLPELIDADTALMKFVRTYRADFLRSSSVGLDPSTMTHSDQKHLRDVDAILAVGADAILKATGGAA